MNSSTLRVTAGIASVATAGGLLALKLIWWQRSGSVSLLASATDSALDLISSAVILVALVAAIRPADDEHRYGHGKAEALAGFVQSLVIFGSGGYVIYRAVRGLVEPQPLRSLEGGIVVMTISLAATGLLVIYQGYVARRTGSSAVKADRLHYLSDILANLAVIASLAVERLFPSGLADFAGGMLTAGYVLRSSWAIFRESFDVLMDRDVSHLYRDTLQDFIAGRRAVLGYHDLRSRSAGNRQFLEVHLELDHRLSFEDSHMLVEELVQRLASEHPGLEPTVHSDPAARDPRSGEVTLPEESNTDFV